MENSSKTPINSHIPLLAKKMPALIDQWRAEISQNKNYRSRLEPLVLKRFLTQMEANGLPALLVALTVLSCEWVFRIRRATEEDIENELLEMEKGFCKPLSPILTPFQAHLLIKLLESNLRKELKNIRIPIIHGFESGGPHPGWPMFSPGEPQLQKRVAPKRVIPNRAGRTPLLGPIIAGVVVGALAEKRLGKDGWMLGQELCGILLNRKVLAHEFDGWRKIMSGLPVSLDSAFGDRMQRAHYQNFEMPGEAISPELFLKRCETEPKSVLWWLAQDDILKAVYSAKWSGSKTRKKRRS